MKMKLLLIPFTFLALQMPLQSAEEIRLCYEDVTVFPWITGDREGLALFELKKVEEELGIEFTFIRLPWARCQMEAEAGKIEGLIAASFTKERANWGVYPTLPNGELDPDRRLHTDSFHVYVRNDSKIQFKNGKFVDLANNQIGVQLGYSVGNDLKNQGYNVHSSFASAYDIIKQLDIKALEVAVLQNHESKRILKLHPELNKNIRRIEEPYKIKDQYLLFTKKFYVKNEAQVKAIWKSVSRARKSKLYKLEEEKILKNNQSMARS